MIKRFLKENLLETLAFVGVLTAWYGIWVSLPK